jgi:hypothetical protein
MAWAGLWNEGDHILRSPIEISSDNDNKYAGQYIGAVFFTNTRPANAWHTRMVRHAPMPGVAVHGHLAAAWTREERRVIWHAVVADICGDKQMP